MDRADLTPPTRWWSPQLSPFWIRRARLVRRYLQKDQQRLLHIDVEGREHVQQAIDGNQGVLITPNHSCHADAFTLYHAADELDVPFSFMTAFQVLENVHPVRRWLLRKHGCFSVNREGTDLRAFRQAVEILQSEPYPLVIFPEGEVYHTNERVTPFREGPATIALSAAKRAERPIVCVPCGMRYYYVNDPTDELKAVMSRLEQAMFWRPRTDLPLHDRIYRMAEGLLALKEIEYLDETRAGDVPDRVAALAEAILHRWEGRTDIASGDRSTPERVKQLRQHAIDQLQKADESPVDEPTLSALLDDMHVVVQLYSYPGDYVAERPSIERIAETIDKLEEDVIGVSPAIIRGSRQAVVSFGEPISVDTTQDRKEAAPMLTRQLEYGVQSQLSRLAKEHGAQFN